MRTEPVGTDPKDTNFRAAEYSDIRATTRVRFETAHAQVYMCQGLLACDRPLGASFLSEAWNAVSNFIASVVLTTGWFCSLARARRRSITVLWKRSGGGAR